MRIKHNIVYFVNANEFLDFCRKIEGYNIDYDDLSNLKSLGGGPEGYKVTVFNPEALVMIKMIFPEATE